MDLSALPCGERDSGRGQNRWDRVRNGADSCDGTATGQITIDTGSPHDVATSIPSYADGRADNSQGAGRPQAQRSSDHLQTIPKARRRPSRPAKTSDRPQPENRRATAPTQEAQLKATGSPTGAQPRERRTEERQLTNATDAHDCVERRTCREATGRFNEEAFVSPIMGLQGRI